MDLPEKLVAWLQDAYAVEQHVQRTLQSYAATVKDYPEISAGITGHIAQTQRHSGRLEGCLKSLGRAHSEFESIVAKFLSVGQAATTSFLKDAVLSGCAAAYTLEHLEVATYRVIITTAEEANLKDIAKSCRDNMTEDLHMADWLLERLPGLTRRYLDQASGYGG